MLIKFHLPISKILKTLHLQNSLAIAMLIIFNCIYCDLISQNINNSYDSQSFNTYSNHDSKQLSSQEVYHYPNQQPVNTFDLTISELDYGKGGIYDGRKPEDEIISLRDATSKHFKNADGTYNAILTAGAPLNYFENGIWKTVRKEILPNNTGRFSEYAYANITNVQKTYYSEKSSGGSITKFDDYLIKEWVNPEIAWIVDGHQIESIKIKDSEAEVDLNQLTYKNCFSGIDVCFSQKNGGKKLDYIINDNSIFLNIPDGAEYMALNETIILPDGWTIKSDSISCIHVYDENEICIFTYMAPEYYDNNAIKTTHLSKYLYSQTKNILQLSTLIPVDWLTSPERAFPIIIDPITQIYASQGGYQSAGGIYSNDPFYNFVGLYSSWHRGYAKFNTHSIHDSFTINNASLVLFCNGAFNTNSVTISAYSIETYYGPYSAYNVNYYNDLGDGTNYNSFPVTGSSGYNGPFILTGAASHIQTELTNDRFQIGFTSDSNWKRFGSESYILVDYTTSYCITNFYPMSACYNSNTLITIEGYEFTEATDVQINGTSCPFTVINDNTITVSVTNGATSGYISVTTPAGTTTSAYQITITIISDPTSVTSTPSTICSGGTADLNASSSGNIINWYTVSVGGTSIGSSASNEDFPINPISTTTYYAESQNGGNRYYINSNVGVLWVGSENDPVNAMNTVFGAGNWIHEYFETVNVSELLSPKTSFIYLEGSCLGAIELETFLTAHITDIENWVSNGGHLLLKSAPNEDNGINFGFGGILCNYPATSNFGESLIPNHQIFNSPYLVCGTYFTGSSFAHASITGSGLTNLFIGTSDRISLAEKTWGSGKVMFSGMTLPYWWNPDPNSSNLLNNIIYYLGYNSICTSDNRIPVTVTVVNDPSLSDATFTDNEICIGVSVDVSSSLSGGTDMSLQWEYSLDNIIWNSVADNTPIGAIYTNQTTENLTISGITAAGTYYYRLYAISTGEGCTSPVYSNSDQLIVYTQPAIAASNDGPYCAGNNINLSATGTSGVTYSWTGPNAFSDNNQNPQIISCNDSHDGIYTVTVEDPDGCTASSQTTVIVDTENPTASNPLPVSVECISDLPAPDISVVTDEADNVTLTPTVEWIEDVSDSNYCPEVITRNYKVSDDCLNSINVYQTITIIPVTPPSVPADEFSTVECLAAAVPPTTPVVTDQCGNNITPVLESMTDNPDPIDCEGTRTYVYSYTDCAGNVSYWTYTYTIDLSTAPVVTADEFSTVECLAAAVAPTTPVVTDQCGNNITPVLESMTDNPDPIDCEGTRTYVYSYTDCAGNVSYWTYTYTIDLSTAPIVSADEFSTVECLAAAVPPTTPVVTDQCGNNIAPVLESMTDNPDPLDCEGTRTYIYSYTDCAGNVSYWTYTYTIDLSTAPVVSADEFSTVECLAAAVAPTTPVVTDQCGNNITPVLESMTDNPDPLDCEGTRTYVYSYTDCAGNVSYWTYTYTIDLSTAPVVSADEFSTVECLALAVAPTTPVVTDQCGNNITPVLESMTDNPDPLDCEGTRTYVYSYTDCAGNVSYWTYTYTIDLSTAPVVSADEFSTVECLALAVPPTTPVVTDQCGNNITPVLESMTDNPDPLDCEGTRTYVYSYTDCAGNVSYWQYTYTIDLSTAPVVSADEFSTVECLALAVAPTTPVVTDQCGNNITPVLESMTDNPDPLDCEGARTYIYSYTDCAGNVSYWQYTYTIDLSTAPIVSADEFSTVECLAAAVPPTTPVVTDQCGNNITPVLESMTDNPDPLDCEGTRTYVYSYTDCAGNVSYWTYTYTIDLSTAPVVSADEFSTVECLALAVAPTTPVVTDQCGNSITVVPDSIIDNPSPLLCAGTRTYYYSYTDCSGNTSNWKYIYYIEDPIISIICPEDQSFDAMPGDTYTIPELIASDNCSGTFDIEWTITGATDRTGTGSDASGVFNIGISNISWTITDICGTIHYCNTQVEIIFPTIICPNKLEFCSNIGIQLISGSGESPSGGVFSGPGITEDLGYYYFDPSIGSTTHIITYTWHNINNYEGSCSFEITVFPAPEFTFTYSNNPTCYSYTDGEIGINVPDGTPPYFVDWQIETMTTSLSDITLFNLAGGDYNIIITDSQLCTHQESITLTEPEQLLVSIDITSDYNGQDISCYSMSDGALSTSISGGTSPYFYLWSENTGSQTTPDVANLSADYYSVTVSDDHDCQAFAGINLTQPEELIISYNVDNNVSCNGFEDGSASLIMSGGTPEYSYLWDDPLNTTTMTAAQLPVGVWNVTVTDLNWCTVTTSIEITEPEALGISHTFNDVVCYGEENGSISVTVTGGTIEPEGYYYLWNDPEQSTTSDLQNIPAGIYIVTVTDANSCTITDTVTISQPEELLLSYSSTPVMCGNSLGSLVAIVSGGNGGYTYEWSDGSHEDHLDNLLAGDYNVAVWDDAGCSVTTTAHVDMEGDIAIYITEEHPITCYGYNDGILSADSPNGEDPIEFLWSTGDTVKIIDSISSGSYTLTISDDWGCTGYYEYYLSQPDQISVDFNPTDILCFADSLGSIDATISGGTMPYSFIWSTGDSVNLALNDLHHGQYIITVTDNNNCIFSNSVFIHNYVIPDPFLGHDTTLCEGDIYMLTPVNDYAIYQWNTGDTLEYIYISEPGYYSLSVTDIHGCTETSSLYISYAPYPEIVSTSTTVGSITINAIGGSPPYNYSHNGDSWQQSNTIVNLPSDTYTVWVRDNNYCIVSTEVFLDEILIIPSFFTPNGDGYNDVWIIEGLYQFPEAEVFVYDRFGKKLGVIYATDYGWNGHYMGNLLPSDTYWYTIDLNDGSSPMKGHVTIKR